MENIPKYDHVPTIFSTFEHPPEFWEEYGRVIATYGFLEHTLYGAICLFSGYLNYPKEELPEKLKRRMRKSIVDSLNPLISEFEKAIRGYPNVKLRDLELLLTKLNETVEIRNMFCHAFWGPPDSNGSTVPFYFDKSHKYFDQPVDLAYLNRTRRHVTELINDIGILIFINGLKLNLKTRKDG
ncbi:MAG: hypothetical protein OXH90_04740 [Paracoccaceae bacterium]|nr:hypothetical protein [Paracoccaceae bacterium]MDE2917874.1 hypothetical protein [Paracoccaceae bacterium]